MARISKHFIAAIGVIFPVSVKRKTLHRLKDECRLYYQKSALVTPALIAKAII